MLLKYPTVEEKYAFFLMFSFHRLLKIRDPHWSAEVKQKSTQKLICTAAIPSSFFHTWKRRQITEKPSVRLDSWSKIPCLLLLPHAVLVRGLPHLPPKKGIIRISIGMRDQEKGCYFQTIQVQAFFSFLRDVCKFTHWAGTKICTFEQPDMSWQR